jgi:photosystem II stability/assembly factor-like uncharacterized protein
MLRFVVPALAVLTVSVPIGAQSGTSAPPPARPIPRVVPPAPTSPMTLDSAVFGGLRWRDVGPPRGGRSVAVGGSTARPNEYWMGTTGGGVFKTTDGGLTWTPMSDRYFGGTIGAIAVDQRNPDIVWVGGGETCIRGNTAHGDGLWKTTDGGRTWTLLGFHEEHIASIELDWRNSNVAYMGVFGNPFRASPNRGLFKTTDGGRTFNKTLYVNDSTGVIDIQLDPTNPDILYVAMWQAYRTPWSMSSGGVHSGLHKSTDGGATWTNLSQTARGFPKGITGKIGIAVSPAKPSRIWAQVEHDSGGLFRSDDAGQTWQRMNADRRMMQRAWYYSHVYADPKDSNVVYSLNVGFHKSRDGGRTFPININPPHGDNHDLWIAPDDPNRMVNANDGGANVSVNGGTSWTDQDFSTAQWYHVDVTNEWPYHICGAQQDNSTLCGPSRGGGGGLDGWYDAGGGESGYVTPNPRNPDIIFAGSYGGLLTRKDRKTGFERNVTVFPINPMGHSSEDIEVRFQWTFPIVFSRHTPNVVYAAGSKLFRSSNEGQSWTAVSPDLARKDPKTMGPSGGPITRDQTGVETYALIFAFDESPVQAGVLWAGTDDGLVWVSRNNGVNWTNVTPPDIGDFTRVSIIEPSNFVAGGAFIAANRYQQGDKQPIIFKTTDYGRTWTKIVNGIKADHFVRVVREDPVRRGMLFAGTERGVYVTFDEGLSWQSLNRNLPIVPVHDIKIKDNDVILATHGRAFWVMDNMSALREATPAITQKAAHLFRPVDAYRTQFFDVASGAVVQYWLKERGQRVNFEFLDARGQVIRTFTSDQDPQVAADSIRRATAIDSVMRAGASRDSATRVVASLMPAAGGGGGGGRGGGAAPRVPNQPGMNTFAWNLRYPDAERFTNLIMWAAGTQGPIAPPGTYSVRMTVGNDVQTYPIRVRKDPRSTATDAELQEQFQLLLAIRDKVSEANLGVRTVRNMRSQVGDRTDRLNPQQRAEFTRLANVMMDSLTYRENEVYQTRNQSGQDPLNYPIRLNNKIAALSGVVGAGEYKPTNQSREAFVRLSRQLDAELAALKRTLDTSLPALNAILRAAGLPELKPSTDELPPRRGPIAM